MINYIKALIIMFQAHKGQKDKAGRVYIFHPLAVSFGVKTKDAKIVALLHDVLEDSNYTIKDLDFLTEEQKHSLVLLTHKKNESYFNYIEKIKSNDIAKQVKLSDLKHNSNLKRLKNITEEDLERVKKYKKAMEILRR
ncbi:HD domain protein [Peptostreptococcaceae bacterium AS15]|nr:HD domain protein [Peptostreptococcaceae bacterium AS15]